MSDEPSLSLPSLAVNLMVQQMERLSYREPSSYRDPARNSPACLQYWPSYGRSHVSIIGLDIHETNLAIPTPCKVFQQINFPRQEYSIMCTSVTPGPQTRETLRYLRSFYINFVTDQSTVVKDVVDNYVDWKLQSHRSAL